MGRTGHQDDCGHPNFGLLQSTKTIIPTPITKKEKKANLEVDLLAGSTDVSRTGHHKTVAAPIYFGLLQSTWTT